MSSSIGSAQLKKAEISFNETKHDFGQFPEDGGDVFFAFILSNTGEVPFVIQEVKTSCSCTVSEWSSAPVLPGENTQLLSSYKPQGRPGYFTKYIQIFTTTRSEPYTLYITGEVIPRPKTREELYPIVMGGIRLETKKINLGDISSDKTQRYKVGIINTSKKVQNITFDNSESYLNISCTPFTLQAGEKGQIIIDFDAKAKNDWGKCYENINLKINDAASSAYRIKLEAMVVDKFEDWSAEQLALAPAITINTKKHLFPDAKAGDRVICPFVFSNTGKSEFIIHKIKHACSCTSDDYTNIAVPAGQSITLNITLDTKDLKGLQRKTITLYTNAPQHRVLKIAVQGKVD